jgi:catechol 2,3-dioxygenase-like lactoylglutathione lyase family enzyme
LQLHRGRLVDHIHLRTTDLKASQRFYKAVLDILGITSESNETHFWADELWIDAGERSSVVHLAFQAPDRETVDRFYQAGLEAGGRDNGAPGERAYHPGYYAAFLLDPDGNNIEAVYHGPAQRSAPSITLTF